MHNEPSGMAHFFGACQRLKRAEQDASSLSFPLARHVQTVVVAVDEIHVRESRRPKQNRVASRIAGGGMSGGIVLAKVSFDFHDARGEIQISGPPDQHLSQELPSHAPRITPKERALERANRAKWGLRGQELNARTQRKKRSGFLLS